MELNTPTIIGIAGVIAAFNVAVVLAGLNQKISAQLIQSTFLVAIGVKLFPVVGLQDAIEVVIHFAASFAGLRIFHNKWLPELKEEVQRIRSEWKLMLLEREMEKQEIDIESLFDFEEVKDHVL